MPTEPNTPPRRPQTSAGGQPASGLGWPPRALLLALLLVLIAGGAATALATSADTTGEVSPSLHLTGNGHLLHPAGRLTTVGNFPTGSAVVPGGRFLWVADCGHGENDIKVMNIASGRVVQTLPLPGCYGGVAISPDGTHAYVGGLPASSGLPNQGPMKGTQGDVIHIFTVNPSTGLGTEQTPLDLPSTSGGSGRMNSLPPVSGAGTANPEGLAISPDGKWLLVALNAADTAVVVNLKTMAESTVSVGMYPNGAAFDPQGHGYVSNEYSGTISVIDPASASVTATITGVGGSLGDLASHPEGMVADPHRPALYVAVTNRDLVAVIDTSTHAVTHLVSVGRPQGLGTAPIKLAISPDGSTLYSADAGEDAVAAISLSQRPSAKAAGRACRVAKHKRRRHTKHRKARVTKAGPKRCASGYIPNLPAFKLIGRIPTAAYPDDVQTTPQGRLLWIAGKGFGSGANPTYYFGGAKTPFQTPSNQYGTYVLDMLIGRVGTLAIPSDRQVVKDTPAANAQSVPSNQQSQPTGSPIPASTGHPSSQIKHVFYIIKENRTYDQLFGTDSRGDGEPQLELFDGNGVSGPTGGITPNAHAITQRFPLLDHFYENSEVSVDGHLIATSAYATDYSQKATAQNYAGRRGTYDFGIYPASFPPRFFLFDQAAKQNVSFRDYGEAVGSTPFGQASNRPEYSKVQSNFDSAYPNNLLIGCLKAGVKASCTQDSGVYNGTGTLFAGQSRFNEWYPQFQSQVASGSVPSLNVMILPDDHTNGTTPGDFTPQAMIADNDLALGQVVDAISHSSIWSSSAIFVVEDDSQDGADHVDSHRSPAYVISPWAKPGVVPTRYDQYSVLRTLELILGLDPLALNDALATPMYNAFISGSAKPNDAPYNVVAPTYDISATNTAAAADAKLSQALPWSSLDAVPQSISDAVLWASVHGAKSIPPPAGPNASPDEVDRAAAMWSLLRQRSARSRTASRSTSCPITWACRPAPPGEG